MITDLTPYREDLQSFDMTDAEKLELVNAIWVIGKNILDKKFGLYQPDYLPRIALILLTCAIYRATWLLWNIT